MRKKKSAPFSIGHVDADTILEMNEPYTPSANDFAPADAAEKESFITRAKSTSYWKDAWRRLRKNTVAMIALGVIIFLVLFAFVGPLLTPYDYSTQMRNEENWPPFWRDADPIVQQKADEAGIKIDKSKHILGTDSLGRDNLTRLMYGTRISITIGLAASLIVLIIGSLIGAISGYLGGAADVVIMRITEIIYSVPDVLVVLLLSTGLKESISAYISNHPGSFSMFLNSIGANLIGMFITFGLIYWVGMCRIIRGQVLMLKQQEYVTAARALGASGSRIIRKHLLPNCVGQIIVTTCLQIPSSIFLESFLSFLGMGVSAPLTSLGSMASDGLSGISSPAYQYRLIVPAILLSLLILSFNLFGDGLRDALDPRLKK